MPGEEGKYSAELFVNIQLAAEEGARRKNWGASRELALYLAHACDHLTGAGDYNNKDRRRMRRRDLRWMKKAEEKGLITGLIVERR
jgi:ssRNA-specific RNase YbeY (16S rRNA maturation enzyme)